MKRGALPSWVLTVAMVTVVHAVGVRAADTSPPDRETPAALLSQAEHTKLSDNDRFVHILQRLHRYDSLLTPSQRWHLKYLDATQTVLKGGYAQAKPALQDIVDHSADPTLSARATAQLIQGESLNHHYEHAYRLANTLLENLPNVADPQTRLSILTHSIQMMNDVGQYDLALKYARQIKTSFPSGTGECQGNLLETQTLAYAHRIRSDNPAFRKTVRSCLAIGKLVFANAMRLDLAGRLTEDGHADKAVALLKRIAPDIRKVKYQYHMPLLQVDLAQAYLRLGDDTNARQSALAALDESSPDGGSWIAQYANEVLYKVEKRAGHDTAALAYYEKYVAEEKANADDTKARALAYQMVKQDVLAKKMRVDALSKQNKILQLRQTLANKATETSRLYIVLLLIVLAFIVVWLSRLKHSQLRFRQLARNDGLTGAFNRQHFLDEARRALQRLHKADVAACLVLLDLDYFKQVNDTHGHAAGDGVLTHIVAICRRELRASDLFGRLGGEEFGILMPACSCEQGIEIATRIRRSMATTPLTLASGASVAVSASFGLACTGISGYDLYQLLNVADAAQYRSKRAGRNQLAVGTAADAPVTGAKVLDATRT